jgi:hypothetical protein
MSQQVENTEDVQTTEGISSNKKRNVALAVVVLGVLTSVASAAVVKWKSRTNNVDLEVIEGEQSEDKNVRKTKKNEKAEDVA